MYSSGAPAGTENWVASCVSAIASGARSCSQATPAVSTSGAGADQKDGLEREDGRLRMASSLSVYGPGRIRLTPVCGSKTDGVRLQLQDAQRPVPFCVSSADLAQCRPGPGIVAILGRQCQARMYPDRQRGHCRMMVSAMAGSRCFAGPPT